LLNVEDFAPYIGAGVDIVGDFVVGAGDGRSVPAAKLFPNLSQGAISFPPEKIHGDTAG